VISVEVPDIGDFDDVPVIEILVSPGDTTITLAGNIVATAIVPEASTSYLLIAGGIFLVIALRMQRRLSASSKH